MAETEGFEPSVPVRGLPLSRVVPRYSLLLAASRARPLFSRAIRLISANLASALDRDALRTGLRLARIITLGRLRTLMGHSSQISLTGITPPPEVS
jgi:hypothetical protein